MSDMKPDDPQSPKQPPSDKPPGYDPSKPNMTLGDLLASDVVGMWEHRTDITDSVEFARKLRDEAGRCHSSDE